MKKLGRISAMMVVVMMVTVALLAPVSVVAGGAVGASAITVMTSNPNFPRDVPSNYNHVIIFDDGTWVTVDDMSTPPTGAIMGWRHESRDGSPPPWGGDDDNQFETIQWQGNYTEAYTPGSIVRFNQIPQFRNDNMSFEPTNHMIENVVRQFVRQLMSQPSGIGLATSHELSQVEQQLSDNFIRELIRVFPQDPAHRMFGSNVEGMMVRFDQLTVGAYTVMPGEPLGIFDTLNRHVSIGTHGIDHNNRQVQLTEDSVVHTLIYELFERDELGMIPNVLVAEHLMGLPAQYRVDWLRYTGLHRAIGIAYVFEAAQLCEAEYDKRMNARLSELNPHFNISYERISVAMGGAGNAIRSQESSLILAHELNIPEGLLIDYLRDVWVLFHDSINPALSVNERNQAAMQFSSEMELIATVSIEHNLGTWGVSRRNGRLISVHDETRRVVDLNNLQIGIFSLWDGPIPQTRRRPSLFPEVPVMLAEMDTQIQAGYTLQNGQWVQTAQPPPTPPPPTRTLRFTINNPTFTDNNTPHTLEAAPFLADNRTMVPLGVIGAALGATDARLSGGVVSMNLGGQTISMTIGQPLPNNMGTPVIVNGRTFVPLAYIIEVMGAVARWDGSARAVYIYIM